MIDLNDKKGNFSRRDFLRTSALVAAIPAIFSVLGSSPILAAESTVIRRENIDDIDPKDYIYALSKLAEHRDDKIKPDNYLYYAWIHNSSSQPCEHNSNLFLPWHRALLYYFELALRNVDPPRTANVRIPFYDYTQLPKPPGVRYPAIFEQPDNILGKMWEEKRRGQGIWKESDREKEALSAPFYSYSEEVVELIENNPHWSKNNEITRGSSNGFAGKPKSDGGKGAVETPQHDWMHSLYIGGQLKYSTTAAFDPIFWSFHAYIDLIFECWIQKYETKTIEPKKAVLNNMPETLMVEDVLDIRKLGYEYPPAPPQKKAGNVLMASSAIGTFSQRKPLIASTAGKEDGTIYKTVDVVIPSPGFSVAPFVIREAIIFPDKNYHGYIYLHPKSENFSPKDALFRERYLVDYFAVLSMAAMGSMPMKTDLSFDLTSEMLLWSERYAGKEWVITVTTVGLDKPSTNDALLSGSKPKNKTFGTFEMKFLNKRGK